jgi:UDP-glucose 4-epimerase
MSSATGDRRVRPRLAILGAEGFIGSAAVRAALTAGAEVTAICVRPPWRLEEMGVAPLRRVRVPDGRWWEGEGQVSIACALADADALLLLAYEPPPPGTTGRAALEHEWAVNAHGARSVAEIAADLGVRVVFASSADVYGPYPDSPASERREPAPSTPYAVAKLEAERLVTEVCRGSRGAVNARLSTVFGPGEHAARAVPSFIRALAAGERPIVHGDGSDVRDYAFVDDVARMLVRCALQPFAFSAMAPVVNVGSGVGRTTLEVLETVARTMGVEAVPRHVPSPRPPSRLVLDVTRACCTLGCERLLPFDEAIGIEAAAMSAKVPA